MKFQISFPPPAGEFLPESFKKSQQRSKITKNDETSNPGYSFNTSFLKIFPILLRLHAINISPHTGTSSAYSFPGENIAKPLPSIRDRFMVPYAGRP